MFSPEYKKTLENAHKRQPVSAPAGVFRAPTGQSETETVPGLSRGRRNDAILEIVRQLMIWGKGEGRRGGAGSGWVGTK